MSIYDFKVLNNRSEEVSLNDYKDKVLLIINSATGCGFTPQYEDLQNIYEELNEKGLEILDFPCNQFGNQASGTDEEIKTFCKGRFGITFPLFKKIEVNGENAEPLFSYLKEKQGFSDNSATMKMLGGLSKTNGSDDIHWNFTKFLVDREGNVVKRFEPTVKMEEVKQEIIKLI